LRTYFAYANEEALLAALETRLSRVKARNFRVLSVESHIKDGGVFVKFSYDAENGPASLQDVQKELDELNKERLPSWPGSRGLGKIWMVQGTPWIEVHTPCSPFSVF
jgi:hypothetical protein